MKILKRILLGFLVVISTPFVAYFFFGAKSYFEGQNLATSSKLPSLYIFEFDSNRRIEINDPNNKFVRSFVLGVALLKVLKKRMVFESLLLSNLQY